MADSDDEYDRKRRDKFRGERTESYARGEGRREERRPREDWPERGDYRSRGRGDYRVAPRDRYSPPRHELSPPVKRMRPDWDEGRPLPYDRPVYPSAYNPGWPPHETPSYVPPAPRGAAANASSESMETQPPMLSLKAFMQTQDDNVGVDDALKKYNEYKLEFRRQQLNEFFVAHKDEEWFKLKYHPAESVARKKELFDNLQRRIHVFTEFLDSGKIASIRVDGEHTDQLTNLLDGVVIKLEGGTDHDMKILDVTAESIVKAQAAEKNKVVPAVEVKKEPEDPDSTDSKEKENSDEKPISENGVKVEEDNDEKKEKGEISDEEEEKLTTIDDKEQNGVESKSEPPPRALHRTSSIFLRNLAPTITKTEVENLCKRYNGFLRVAIADPQPDRRWFRRGWVTFRRDVDIKEICWNLNNIRLRDCELGAIVNRDLSRRVRTVSGLTSLKPVVQHDMKLSAKIIQNLDSKLGLWTGGLVESAPPVNYTLSSKNPVLQNITDFLIEEASAEEEELLGKSEENSEETEQVEPKVLQVLDRLILYLRIVHSVDYYNHCEYPNEDEMPNRCGIIHTRGTLPTSKVTPQEITDYCNTFQNKMSSLVSSPAEPTPGELESLGAKKTDTEVEKFVAANTQEISTDKWLCPLSGKKFKGPDFIRKHIFNKHAEKVEEVKKEVEYFNNYLKDPKRPQLPEHPGNKAAKKEPAVAEPPPAFAPPHFQYGAYPAYQPAYPRGAFGGFNRGGRGYGRGRGGMDFRPVIHYRDLDAPREPEEFI